MSANLAVSGARAHEVLPVRHAATLRVTVIAAAAGVVTDVALQAGVANAAGAFLVVGTALALASDPRVDNPTARILAACAALFGVWLAIRQSPALLLPDIAAAGGLLGLSAMLSSGGSLFDLTPTSVAVRGGHVAAHGLAGPSYALAPLLSGDTPVRRNIRGLVLGVLLAAPIVVVLGVLLASADAVFRSFFRIDAAQLLSHTALVLLGAWTAAGLWRAAAARPVGVPTVARPRLGWVETSIVLGAVNLLLAGFAAAQVVAASEGGRRVLRTAGLTYAEYARSGFFQLVAVAAVTVVVVAGLRSLVAERSRLSFVLLAQTTIALTLVVCAVAFARLSLYERAFGLTMPRLYAQVGVVLIGVLLVLLGVAVAGVRSERRWFVPVATAAVLTTILALNAVNPEAVVVERNVGHAERTGRLDAAYLASLGPDAAPMIADALDRIPAADRVAVSAAFDCTLSEEGIAGWNLAHQRARAALRTICGIQEGA